MSQIIRRSNIDPQKIANNLFIIELGFNLEVQYIEDKGDYWSVIIMARIPNEFALKSDRNAEEFIEIGGIDSIHISKNGEIIYKPDKKAIEKSIKNKLYQKIKPEIIDLKQKLEDALIKIDNFINKS